MHCCVCPCVSMVTSCGFFFLTLSYKAGSSLSGSLLQVNDETSFMLKKKKKCNSKPDFFSELMDATAYNWSIAFEKEQRDQILLLWWCIVLPAAAEQSPSACLQDLLAELSPGPCCLSSFPAPVFIFLPSHFVYLLSHPPVSQSVCLWHSQKTRTLRVLINLFTLTSLRFSSRSWNTTRHWRRLWPSSWTASAQLKHARKEEMQLT